MPSQDKFHEERPETNSWLGSDPSIPKFATPPGSSHASQTARARSEAANAAVVQALAARLGLDAEELAKRIPADTLRRLKFPVMEQIDPDTGLRKFKHDLGIVSDRGTPLLAIDRAHEAIEKGMKGRGAGVPQPRSNGRFSK